MSKTESQGKTGARVGGAARGIAKTPNTYKSPAQRLLLEHVARTGESISSIARAAGLRLFALQKIQKGVSATVKPETAAKLATHFGCPVEEILGRPLKPSGDAFPTQLAKALAPKQTTPAPAASGVGTDEGRHSPPKAATNGGALESDRDIPWHRLVRSDLNPRQPDNSAEAKEKLQQLADDLFENGQLQNIIVRPHATKAEHFEIVAGDRRYRAFGLNIKAGRKTRDDTMRSQVRQLNDRQARAIALVENLQHQTLTAAEEGDAFVALTELGWETKDLAERIHKSLTYVQQRISLVRRAVPELRKALAKGEITFDAARTLAAGKPEAQLKIVAAIRSNDYRYRNADMIRQELTRDLVPARLAIFPLADYKGEREEIDGEIFLADRNEFNALQDKAVKEKKKDLVDAGWSWVTIAEFIHAADFEPERSANRKKAGCLIVHKHNGEVEVHEGLVEKAPNDSAASGVGGAAASRAAEENQYEKQMKAAERFCTDLAAWIARRPALALRLYVYQGELERALAPTFGDNPIVSWPEIAAASEKELGKIVMAQIGLDRHRADEAMVDLAKKAGLKVPAHMLPKNNGAGASGVGGAAASARATSKTEARAS